MSALLELAERLERRAADDRIAADNSAATFALLEPEFAKFEARNGPWNTYVVRMAVDHRNSAKRDAAFANDLKQAAAALRAQARGEQVQS